MAIAVHQTYNVDLQKGAIEKAGESLVRGNQYAHTYHVKLTNGDKSAPVEAVNAMFNRADGVSVRWNGAIEVGGVAVTLTPECYAIAGNGELFVNVLHGDSKLCVLHLTMYIDYGAKDAVVDPGNVIPDINVLLAEVENMRTATQSANEAAGTAATNAELALTAASNADDAADNANTQAELIETLGIRVDETVQGVITKLPTWDEHYALQQQVEGMTSLPNPYKLTFTGAASAVYDGTEAVTVNIPAGGGGTGEGGSDGATFIPSVNDGVLSWSNDGGLPNPEPVVVRGERGDDGSDGLDGITFTPSVDAEGNLSWTNNGGADNPPTVNIKGPKGDGGEGGGSSVTIDATLTKSGQAADAKVVGDRIGTLTSLATSSKGNLVAAINETFTSVSEGKQLLASALADKEQIVDAGATFAAMADAIRAISGAPSFAGMQFGYFTPDANQTTVTINHTLGEIPTCVIVIDTSNVSSGTTLRQIANIYAFNKTNGAINSSASFSLFANSSSVIRGIVQGGLASASNVRVNGASISNGSASLPFLIGRKYMYVVKGGDK